MHTGSAIRERTEPMAHLRLLSLEYYLQRGYRLPFKHSWGVCGILGQV